MASAQCNYCHLGVCVDIRGSFVLFYYFGGPAVVISNILNSVLQNSNQYTLVSFCVRRNRWLKEKSVGEIDSFFRQERTFFQLSEKYG